MQALLQCVKDGVIQSNATELTDVQKFFADVQAAVDQLQNLHHLKELVYDPINTWDLMWDPVSQAGDSSFYISPCTMEAAVAGLLAPQLIPALTEGITQLIKYLAEVRAIKKHNKLIQEEITNFSERLRSNLELVRTKLPERVSGVALDTLVKDLQKANEYMQQSLAEGKFKTFWSAKETRACLEALRQKLMASFQMAFLVTSLDVALEGHRSTENFQGVMVELFWAPKSHSAAAQAEMRDLFRPLVVGQNQHMRRQEQMTKMMDDMRATLAQIASQQEDGVSEKFSNDVATVIRQLLSDSTGESSGSANADNEEFREAST
ncbi:hypothetical protein R1sor_020867 [Riccia sorocarpa]|uniref:Uncharacterized protein n=1 Tax=Riccia sorocarpa TaxID=122646 RepID=A0ABD3GH34_9MARC